MSKYDDLVSKLKEIFQIDKPELDFGVYRILNARAGEINDYLENRLQAKVSQSLATAEAANTEKLQKELQEKQAQYRADGIDPNTVPKLLEIKEKLAAYSTGSSEHENAVFSHLLTFFSRYYDSGDFISQRRYKGDTYAIPYAGEEVLLHWANKDQYYTKSGENFANYAFKLDDGRSVRFRLIAADTAKDNRKDNDKERRFVLLEAQTRTLTDDDGDEYQDTLQPISEENGELVIRFEYKAMPKGSKQDALVQAAVQKILETLSVGGEQGEVIDMAGGASIEPLSPQGRGQGEGHNNWHTGLSQRHPTEKNPQRTLLEKMLTSYTSKNTADYFIHKDLGGFLRRELDFYIKNEVMNLDDVQTASTFADIEKNLRLIQTLRVIALDLITFLAQLEDFQKKLWLKKKFVVASHYCLTLDRVPEDLYATIAANPQQWQQWQDLGMLDDKAPFPLSSEYPKQNAPSPLRGGGWGEGLNKTAFPVSGETPKQSTPSPLRGEGWGEGLNKAEGNHTQIKTRTKAERSEIIQRFVKDLRQAPTDAEARLWYFLRNRRLDNKKFRRQHAIGNYIVDFICVESELVIELDGGQHADLFAQQADEQRSAFLAERGLRVLRFWNNDVLRQTEVVLEQILQAFDEAPHPSPLPTGERERLAAVNISVADKAIASAKAPSPLWGEGWGEGQSTQIAYLKAHPYLMVDTALFAAEFKHTLLATLKNLDDSLDGLLIHGDNFQALNLLQERYREQVKCIYIDPPYNTGEDGFIYKDAYPHSSWLTMMIDRLSVSYSTLSNDGVLLCSIDDYELNRLHLLMKQVFSHDEWTATFIRKRRSSSAMSQNLISQDHEYVTCYTKNDFSTAKGIPKEYGAYKNPDNDPRGDWMLDNLTVGMDSTMRPNQFYELISPFSGKAYPANPNRVWAYIPESMAQRIAEGRIGFPDDPKLLALGINISAPMLKRFKADLKSDVNPVSTLIDTGKGKKEDGGITRLFAGLNTEATKELQNAFGNNLFSYAKPISLVSTLIEQFCPNNTDCILDYFAGSGTTAHAVINLNREDALKEPAKLGKRKYILVEQGDYFDTVLKPRIQKVVYSADWKDGKPSPSPRPSPQKGEGDQFNGISHAFKVLKLESYEDTLNNLNLRRSPGQQDLLESLPEAAQQDYLLRYLLNIESRGSLLSVAHFDKPFAYQLKVAVDSAGAYQERAIDLVETFNYLIGLRVNHINSQPEQGFVTVTGWLPTGEKTLILWRDVEQVDYDGLNRLCAKLAINPADSEFELVYINGDHNIPTAFTSLETEGGITKQIKIRQIEAEFLSRMFG